MHVGKGKLLVFNWDTQRSVGGNPKERNHLLVNSMVDEIEDTCIVSENNDESPNFKAKKNLIRIAEKLKTLEESSIGYIDRTFQFVLPHDEYEVINENNSISLDKLNIFKVLGIQQTEYSDAIDRNTTIEFIRNIITKEDEKYKSQPRIRKIIRKILNYNSIWNHN